MMKVCVMCALLAATLTVESVPVNEMTQVDTVLPETLSVPAGDASAEFGMEDALSLVQKTGKDACVKLADAGIAEVEASVNENKRLLKNLSDGRDCAAKGQAEVAKAAKDRHNRVTDEGKTLRSLNFAKSQSVSFKITTLVKAEAGSCGDLWSSSKFKDAKAKLDTATKRFKAANLATKLAKIAFDTAVASAKKQKEACLCNAKSKRESTWAAYQKTVDANDKLWKKSHKIKCAARELSPCKIPDTPVATNKVVISDVTNAKCAKKKLFMLVKKNTECSSYVRESRIGSKLPYLCGKGKLPCTKTVDECAKACLKNPTCAKYKTFIFATKGTTGAYNCHAEHADGKTCPYTSIAHFDLYKLT